MDRSSESPRLFRRVLSDELFHDFATHVSASSEEIRGCTAWYDLATGPVLLTEHIICELLVIAQPGVCAGAEWWFQVNDPNEGMGMHFDKDEATLQSRGELRHPKVASVFYLTNGGSRTLVLEQRPTGPEIPERGYLVVPAANSYLVFPGDLRHGTSPVDDMAEAPRITFLVNFWSEMPVAENFARSEDLKKSFRVASMRRSPGRPERLPLTCLTDPVAERDESGSVVGLEWYGSHEVT